jgi:hydrogenase nickel incorporation protein HypA/HybF
MHELSLIPSLIEIVAAKATEQGCQRVKALRLSLGRLAHIDQETFSLAFSVQAQGTAAEGAALEFEMHPIVISCLSCQKEIEVPHFDGFCPECGTTEVLLVEGAEELKLLEITVD